VIVFTDFLSRSPQVVEDQVTLLASTWVSPSGPYGLLRFGFDDLVIFEDKADIYWPGQECWSG
jgi:hypothetical protein